MDYFYCKIIKNSKIMKINKFPKGYYNISTRNNGKITLQFDKNGGLCNMTPKIGDILNTYRGRTRAFIPEIKNAIYDELSQH